MLGCHSAANILAHPFAIWTRFGYRNRLDFFRDPVACEDGFTYERAAIQKVLQVLEPPTAFCGMDVHV